MLPLASSPWPSAPARAGCQGSPAALQAGYLLVDVAHSQVLLVAGAGHSDVLQPVPSPALASVAAELLSAQGIGNLRENGTAKGSEGPNGSYRGDRGRKRVCRAQFQTRNRKVIDIFDKETYGKDEICSQPLSEGPGWQNLPGHTSEWSMSKKFRTTNIQDYKYPGKHSSGSTAQVIKAGNSSKLLFN